MNDFILNFMSEWGYLAITLLITLENVFPPIPSEVILTFGGFMSTYSSLNVILVIIFSIIGSLFGAIILYYIGIIFNVDKLKKMCKTKFGKIIRIKESDIDYASKWFSTKGEYTVFFCRFIPIVRSLISIPAGSNKMNFLIFIIYTFYGSLIWNSVLVILGKAFGEAYPIIQNYVDNFSKIVLLILIFIISFFIFKLIKRKK